MKDCTNELQAMLDKCGTVRVKGGFYPISDTLVIHNNTHLILDCDAVIYLMDNSDCFMIRNDKCISGSADGYNANITVEGGIWDGNNENQTVRYAPEGKTYYYGMVMRFLGVRDITVKNLTVKNPSAYAIQLMFADRFTVENITFDYNMFCRCMDGVHVQGPSRNGYIRNIKGATNDDLVALNCDDYHDNGKEWVNSKGDIENIVIDGLYADGGYTAVRLLSCGSVLRNVSISNVFGTYRFYGVSFTHHNIFPGEKSWFDNININGFYCSKSPIDELPAESIEGVDKIYGDGVVANSIENYPLIWFQSGVKCGNLSMRNIHRDEFAISKGNTILIDDNVEIESLILDNATHSFHNSPEVEFLKNNGLIKKLKVIDGE